MMRLSASANRVSALRAAHRVRFVSRVRARLQGSTDDRSATFVMAGACALAIGWALSVPLGIMVGVALALNPTRKARETARTETANLERDLPATADLLGLAVGAGYSTTVALEAVTTSTHGALSDALADALRKSRSGIRLIDCLAEASDALAPSARPLFDLLISSERDGAPISEGLARLAAGLRRSRSRRSRAAARRLPVLLLAPMTCCVLPAFALLVVAPVLVEGFASLDLLLPK